MTTQRFYDTKKDTKSETHSDSKPINDTNTHKKQKKNTFRKVTCNLCEKEFKTKNKFVRFCNECKSDNDLLFDFI